MDSLRAVGLVQPIVVERLPEGRCRILCGERRYTAALRLGWTHVPAIVRSRAVHRRLEAQLLENLHRKALHPFEEADAYRRLMEEFGLTQNALGRRL
jgi:ParB family chromosome partitioning protein